MRVTKLGAGFGAETDRLDAPFQEIWDAFLAAQVLVFRGLRLFLALIIMWPQVVLFLPRLFPPGTL
jgi:hypothetical protein